MARQWLINYPKREAPSTTLPAHPIFDTWRKHIGPITPEGGDYEYFVEEAYRLHCAIESFGAENSWLHHQWGTHVGHAKNVTTGEWRSEEELLNSGASIYGARVSNYHRSLGEEKADDYAHMQAFLRNAGRYIEVGGFNTEDDHDISEIFSRMVERGIAEGLLKRRLRKNPLIPFNLSQWDENKSVSAAINDEDAQWSLIYDEGRGGAYIVQERIPMRYEYRTFIIGHEPVTGAGCVEEYTPIDGRGEQFDDRVREYRNSKEQVVSMPDVRDTLVEFTRKVASEVAIETPDIGGYTLDTALDAEGNPLVVELNSHFNSGFFACQPHRITEALSNS